MAPETRKRPGTLPTVSTVLGFIAVLSGFGGNSAVLLLGIVAIVLGVVSWSRANRALAWWGIGLASFAILGYVGSLAGKLG